MDKQVGWRVTCVEQHELVGGVDSAVGHRLQQLRGRATAGPRQLRLALLLLTNGSYAIVMSYTLLKVF